MNRLGYRAAFAAFALALSACASAPVVTGGPAGAPDPSPAPRAAETPQAASGYATEKVSANRYRVTYKGATAPANFRQEAMKRAARATLDNGKEWFEIVGSTKSSLEIITGSGESLAGGATQHDARAVLNANGRTS